MQEFTDIVVSLIPYIFSTISLLIAIAVYVDSRKKEKTRQIERMTEALSQCHMRLEEAIRMVYPHLNYSIGFHPSGEFAEEIIKRADLLNSLSWDCKHLGEDIRNAGAILTSMVVVLPAASDKFLSNEELRKMLDNLATIRNKIAEYLKELHQ